MSLVFDALRQQGLVQADGGSFAPAGTVPDTANHTAAVSGGRTRMPALLLGATGVLVTLGVGMLWRDHDVHAAHLEPAPVLAPAVVTALKLDTNVSPVLALALREEQPKQNIEQSSEPRVVKTARAVPVKQVRQAEPVKAQPEPVAVIASVDAKPQTPKTVDPVVAPAATRTTERQVDNVDLAALFRRFTAAANAGQLATAQSLIEQTAEQTGAESTLVMRMTGFLALKQGQLERARNAYTDVVDRMPDDREANMNLVLIDLQQGASAPAKQRAQRLQERYPDDAAIRTLTASIR
jgi:hypothetical protein